MIGYLRGRLAGKHPPALVIDVGGVGYELEAPMSTFYQLPEVGEDVKLFTHLVVREDAHLLYGFASEPERRLFRDLLRVSGVGPKIGRGCIGAAGASSSARIRSRISTTSRSAVLRPMPGTRTSDSTSCDSTHSMKDSTSMPDSSARPIFGPTPVTRSRSLNRRRSASVANP